jgi:hypothetical protein
MTLARSAYRAVAGVLGRQGRYVLDGVAATLTGHPTLLRHGDLTMGLVRRRLAPDGLFVGWILNADEDGGGARVHALAPHAYLRRIGVNSVILRKPRPPCTPVDLRGEAIERLIGAGLDVVVFQKVVGEGAEILARRLGAAGTRTVYVAGDFFGHEMARTVDQVVAASEQLTKVAGPHQDRVAVIEPVIDAPAGLVKDHRQRPRTDRIRVVWVGYPENVHLLGPVREALRDPRLARYELVTISRGPGVTHQWHRRRVYRQILDCDIAVLPADETDWYQVKPNTRLTMFKSLGLPTVASPIDSYQRTLAQGRSCYFARTTSDWVEALLELKEPDRRREIGLADREQILASYGPEAIGQKWLALLQAVAAKRVSPGHPGQAGRWRFLR